MITVSIDKIIVRLVVPSRENVTVDLRKIERVYLVVASRVDVVTGVR